MFQVCKGEINVNGCVLIVVLDVFIVHFHLDLIVLYMDHVFCVLNVRSWEMVRHMTVMC